MSVVGSPTYMAPEVYFPALRHAPLMVYTEKADMWSLGVTLYIAWAGSPPFDASLAPVAAREWWQPLWDEPGWFTLQGVAFRVVLTPMLQFDHVARRSAFDAAVLATCAHPM